MSDIKMKNYMEDCVADILPSILANMDICQCERCRMDIMANVLNKLPPKYVVTKAGSFYTKLSGLQSQATVDIIAAVTNAATLIAANPRHNVDV